MPPTVDPGPTNASLRRAHKNIRFGIARGLTQTAKLAQSNLEKNAAAVFDRPIRRTIKGFYVSPAKREKLVAEVGVKDDFYTSVPVEKYLRAQIFGGTRRQKRSERALSIRGLMGNMGFWVPGAGIRLNKFGNVTGGAIVRILSQLKAAETKAGYTANETAASRKRNRKRVTDRYFVPKPGGQLRPGVYVRQKSGRVRPALIFVPTVFYRKRFDFFGIVKRTAQRNVAAYVRQSIKQAFATSRRR